MELAFRIGSSVRFCAASFGAWLGLAPFVGPLSLARSFSSMPLIYKNFKRFSAEAV